VRRPDGFACTPDDDNADYLPAGTNESDASAAADSLPEPGLDREVPARAWLLTLETGGGAENHEAEFADLVALARAARVVEVYVWAAERRDFVRSTSDTLRETP
jgi:hypothetical protein